MVKIDVQEKVKGLISFNFQSNGANNHNRDFFSGEYICLIPVYLNTVYAVFGWYKGIKIFIPFEIGK